MPSRSNKSATSAHSASVRSVLFPLGASVATVHFGVAGTQSRAATLLGTNARRAPQRFQSLYARLTQRLAYRHRVDFHARAALQLARDLVQRRARHVDDDGAQRLDMFRSQYRAMPGFALA